MLVIGIDPGTATTGFGLIRQLNSGPLELVDFGVVETPAGMAMPERLMRLHTGLTDLLRRHSPDSGAVEKLFFQRNVSTAISVGQARGVALLALAQAGVPVDEYSPREVKQAVSSYGDADKRQMQEMVRILLRMESTPHPDDAADALAVAICHVHTQGVLRRLDPQGGET